MRKAHLICLIATVAGLDASAKEDCIGIAELVITRSNGGIEHPQIIGIPTVFLGQGDSAVIQFYYYMPGWDCHFQGFFVTRNGELIEPIPNSYYTYDVTTPGFYEDNAVGIDLYGTGQFYISYIETPPLILDVKAWLQGPFDANTGLMRHDLLSAGLVPYWSSAGPADSSVLNTNEHGTVVDWVSVEIRMPDQSTVFGGIRQGLILTDGTIIDPNFFGPLTFVAPQGDYYVVVGHRNHLRAMTATVVSFGDDPVTLDFRDPAFPTYGIEARKIEGDAALLWAGKTRNQYRISYTGNYNDRDAILQSVGSKPMNTITGYWRTDVNMDGVVKYTGANNDRDVILMNLGSTLATTVREEQVP